METQDPWGETRGNHRRIQSPLRVFDRSKHESKNEYPETCVYSTEPHLAEKVSAVTVLLSTTSGRKLYRKERGVPRNRLKRQDVT